MDQSELILKTYREITLKLDKPYYVLEGIPANNGNNQIIYSSPNLKEVLGLSQYELSSHPDLFFNSIHPDFIGSYFESNKRLLQGTEKEKRIYLVRNKETGEFIQVEELASSRLNKERNCYEIYCSLRSINESIPVSDEVDVAMTCQAFNELRHLTPFNRNKIFESTQYFAESMAKHFKMNACRIYSFNDSKIELAIIADTQNKLSKQIFEATGRIKTRSIIPKYDKDSLFFKLLLNKKYTILEDKSAILDILKSHTDSSIIKKLAGPALRIYNVKSFGLLPICCPDGRIVGQVTFGSPQYYTEEQKKEIYDFTTTNSFLFCCLLGEMANSPGQSGIPQQ